MIVYRPPVTCRNAVTDASGGVCRLSAAAGILIPHFTHRAASARFQLPQSVQNIGSGAELHAHEIVRRPRSGNLEVDRRLALGLDRNRFLELRPAL